MATITTATAMYDGDDDDDGNDHNDVYGDDDTQKRTPTRVAMMLRTRVRHVPLERGFRP